MRKFLIPVLLAATVASPALAQRTQEDMADRSGGDRTFERRGGQGGGHGDGNWQRPARSAAPQAAPSQNAQPQYGQRRWDGGGRSNGGMTTTPDAPRGQVDGGRRYGWNDRPQQPPVAQPPQQMPNRTFDRNGDGRPDGRYDRNRTWNGAGDNDRDRNWSGERQGDRHWRGNTNDGRYTNRGPDRRWDNDRDDDRRGQWNRGWRDDRRYDWRRYRNENRNYYRMPRYYDPYGYRYGYRRFSIGIFLDDLFFSSRYWISDPYEYRLPPASGPYRWVRYYDDVLLVDLRNGRVVDVIYDFFW